MTKTGILGLLLSHVESSHISPARLHLKETVRVRKKGVLKSVPALFSLQQLWLGL